MTYLNYLGLVFSLLASAIGAFWTMIWLAERGYAHEERRRWWPYVSIPLALLGIALLGLFV